MKKKTLLLTILGCVLSLVVIVTGVLAMTYLKVNVAGEINFISYDKLVYVEKVVINNFVESSDSGASYNTKSKEITEFSGKYLRETESVSTINLSGMSVIQGEYLTIEITMMALQTDSDLYVECSYQEVAGFDISYNQVKLEKNTYGNVESGQSEVFVIKILNSNSGTVDLSTISIDISFTDKYTIDDNGIITNSTATKFTAVTYTIDTTSKTATASGNTTTTTDLIILDKVYKDNVAYKVTKIADGTSSAPTFNKAKSYIKNLYMFEGISEIGNYAFKGCTKLTKVTIPDSVVLLNMYCFNGCNTLRSVIIGDSVVSIGDYVFGNCSKLGKITIPNSTTTLGKNVFYYCSSLTDVELGKNTSIIGEYSFRYCTKLTEVKLPDSLTKVSKGLFQNCSGLVKIVIPENVTTIDSDAFYGCSSVANIYIGESVSSIVSGALSTGSSYLVGISVNPNNEKYITKDNCLIEKETSTLLIGCKSSIIPDDGSVVAIGKGAFQNCTGLTSFSLPNSIQTIGSQAYYGCMGLTSIDIPSGVTTIATQAFSHCDSLQSISIPDTVVSISGNIVSYCENLATIIMENASSKYKVVNNCLIDISQRKIISGCKNSIIPTDSSIVSSLQSNAFTGSGIVSLVVPDNVSFAEGQVFYWCKSLTTISINISNIQDKCFYGCTSLTSVTLGSRTKSIAGYGFQGCSALKSITIPASVTNIYSDAFDGCTALEKVVTPDINAWAKISMPNADSTPLRYAKNLYITNGTTETLAENVILDTSVSQIGAYAFYYCKSLKSIVIPETVTTIGGSAFYSCSNLTTVYVKSSSVLNKLTSKTSAGYLIQTAITSGKVWIASSIASGYAGTYLKATTTTTTYDGIAYTQFVLA